MARYNDIRALAETHASEISRSVRAWTGYLDTAAQLYRYNFADTLLIHAQRPDATACVELETWNNRMGRWVNRGAKGIALIDDSGPSRRLRYVFDISDTHMVRGGKTPYLWQMDAQLRPEMADYLMDTYGLEYDPDAPLSSVLMALARAQVADNLADAMDGLSYEVQGSYLEGLGEDAVQESFRRLLENSTYYMLARRCGLDPMEELTADDFSGLSNFNRLSVLSFLGNAAHDIAEPVLRDIGREVIFRYRVLATERKVDEMLRKQGFSVESGNVEAYNGFNTLIRESADGGQTQHARENIEGGTSDGSDIHEEGRLPVPEPDDRRGAGGDREVRNAAQDIPEGEQEELVSEHAADREAGEASRGDRPDSGRADGADLGRDGTEGRRGREAEDRGPDGMDPAHEQHPEPRGRDRAEGIGVQLIPEEALDDIDETGPIDLADSANNPDAGTSAGPASDASDEANETETQETPEAEDNNSPAFFMPPITVFPAYPTANQQRRQIEQRIDAVYAGESNIPAEVIDEFLRAGGNRTGSQLRIIYSFMTDPAPEEAAEFVRREYGKGGKGLTINDSDYSVWFDEAGMKFAAGHSVEDSVVDKAYLSWEDVSGRIRQLLAQGEYAPQSVLDAARNNALQEHATALVYMEHDLTDGIAEIVFEDTSIFEGGFPSAVQKVSERLDDPTFLADLVERLEGLAAAYAESPEIMRFPYYNPDRMLAQFRQFSKEYTPFDARDGFAWEEHTLFITQEEADAFLASGGPYSDGRISTYSFFLRHEDTQERADFLKDQYGTGGRSHALSGADDSYADYNAKGIVLNRRNTDHPAVYNMTYTQAARRIDDLISRDRFLTAQDHIRMPAYEREQLAAGVIRFYSSLPTTIQRPFAGSIYDSSTRTEIASMIADPDQLAGLLAGMDTALAGIPEAEPRYQLMVDALADIHVYAEGTYTLFPQPRQDIAVPDARQMSLTDLFEMNVPEDAAQLQEPAAEPSAPTVNPFAWDPTIKEDEVIAPLSAEAASEYNALKQEYRSSLVGFEQNGSFEFYGEDARIIAGLYGDEPLKKEFPWAAAFGETVTAIELAPEGTGYRAKTRFAKFYNLPELITLFKECADIQTSDMLDLPVPEAEYINEVLKPSEEQKELVSTFADRAEAVRAGKVQPTEDNMLKITNDGRKCALDQRLINPMLPDDPESKVNRCVENMFRIWKDTEKDRSTQLCFCDLSTPKGDGSFNVYDDIREKLVAKGIPKEEVAFIHEANTETRKEELFAKVRSGQVRILMGSTPKLGAGTNVQDRLIALHHLDCPWKPSDLEQQEGRILRQGNSNPRVQIYRYVTEASFDSYMWQILEQKQKFISQIMTSKSPVRSCEDVDDTALSYAEIKALATGNPAIKEKMDLDIQVSRLKLLKANHTNEHYRLESDIARTYPMQITSVKERIGGLQSDLAAVKTLQAQQEKDKDNDKDSFTMTIGGKEFTDRKEAGTALIAACAGLKAVRTEGTIGEYAGFSMTASFDGFRQSYVLTLKRQCSYTVEVGKDPAGNITRIQNVLFGVERQLTESRQKLENLQGQLAAAREEVQKPFAHETELTEKSARLAELNAMLNMDERSPVETLGVDEETDQPTCESRKEDYPATVAERAAGTETYADRAAVLREDQKPAHTHVKEKTAGKGSLIERLQSKKAELAENAGRPDFRAKARPEPAL